MDLDTMKNQWDAMSEQLKEQQLLTNKLIIEMTQNRYKKKINSISIPESLGAVICFIMAVIILYNFKKLDTWYLELSGLISVLYLIGLPIIILTSLNKMKKISVVNENFRGSIKKFALEKKRFFKMQKIGFYLNFLLIILILPVMGKLMKNEDLFLDPKIWYWYVPMMFVFIFVFSKWGLKHYRKSADEAETLLKELEK